MEGHTVREGDWKLIFGNGMGGLHRQYGKEGGIAPTLKGELYNLKEDPGETKNLYVSHPEKVRELTRRMEEYKAEGSSVAAVSSNK